MNNKNATAVSNVTAVFILLLLIFFKAYALLFYILCNIISHISVMPRFKINSRNLYLVLWVSENKAIIITMLHHPFLAFGIELAVIQILIFNRYNIKCQSCFMLACSRNGNPFFSIIYCLAFGHSLIFHSLNPIVKKLLLIRGCSVRRTN